MSVLSHENQFIHYEAVGRGAPIIFIHSWLGSWRYWWPAMQALSHSFRAFAFDLWGFGSSSRNAGCYSVENYVAMLQTVVEGLGIAQPISLVGHGLGAAIATRYTCQIPQRVARLVTVALPIRGQDLKWQPEWGHPGAMPRHDWQNHRQSVLELKKADGAAITSLLQELSACDFLNDLSTIQLPRLLIAGDDDPFVQSPHPSTISKLEKEGDCRFLLLSDGGHFPMLEQPATFNRLIRDFMHGLDAAPKSHWQRRTH